MTNEMLKAICTQTGDQMMAGSKNIERHAGRENV
jgi:hypothetical protein